MSSGIIGDAVKEEIIMLIEEKLQEHVVRITQEEVREIVSALIPDINELVSNEVKKHFKILAQYALEKF